MMEQLSECEGSEMSAWGFGKKLLKTDASVGQSSLMELDTTSSMASLSSFPATSASLERKSLCDEPRLQCLS